jgi:virginiamycin B lyase
MANTARNTSIFTAALALAGCLVLGAMVATAQQVTLFPIPTHSSGPWGIAAGSDGALWFTEQVGKIGRITTGGIITEFTLPPDPSLGTGVLPLPTGIAAGPDGALWFTLQGANKIGRITTAGAITEFPIPTTSSRPTAITTGSDGALWFAESARQTIGRIATNGLVTQFAAGSGAFPKGITAGPDGALWFTGIGRITTSGMVTTFTPLPLHGGVFPSGSYNPEDIAAGPDGALWFTNLGNVIGRVSTQGTFAAFAIGPPSVSAHGIASGPGGALWFGVTGGIGWITTSGTSTLLPINVNHDSPDVRALAVGPDGAIWFTDMGVSDLGAGAIGRLR